jgi:hypothetical protein
MELTGGKSEKSEKGEKRKKQSNDFNNLNDFNELNGVNDWSNGPRTRDNGRHCSFEESQRRTEFGLWHNRQSI